MFHLLARAISTGGGIGYIPWAPGTCASLVAVVLAWYLHQAWGPAVLIAVTLFATIGGMWAVQNWPAKANADAPEIVIDEIAGQMLALWPLSVFLSHSSQSAASSPLGWVFGFLFFRLFDILKPWPVYIVDRKSGAVWVMLDDIVAGAMAAGVIIVAGVIHGLTT